MVLLQTLAQEFSFRNSLTEHDKKRGATAPLFLFNGVSSPA